MRGTGIKMLGILVGWVILAQTTATAAELTVTVQSQDGKPIADAVVSLLPAAGTTASAPTKPQKPLIVDQNDEQFSPYVLIVPVGGTVSFRNSDLTRHHIYSFSEIQQFELLLNPNDVSPPMTLIKTGTVALGCNIHDRMAAHLFVTDNADTALTDAMGLAKLDKLSAGQREIMVWHPRFLPGTDNPKQKVTIPATGTLTVVMTVPELLPDTRSLAPYQ